MSERDVGRGTFLYGMVNLYGSSVQRKTDSMILSKSVQFLLTDVVDNFYSGKCCLNLV